MIDQDLVARLRAAIETHMNLALEASRFMFGGQTSDGEHWQWECTNCDTPIPITPVTMLDEMLECPECQSVGVGIRSVERYMGTTLVDDAYPYDLPHLVTHSTEEIRPVDGAHIIAHDPASVLRRCRMDLNILGSYQVLPPERTTEGLEGRDKENAVAAHYVRSTFEIFIRWMAEAYDVG